jgi:V-type H+-transporting ATPase subunit a
MLSTFGYMIFLIIYKFCVDWTIQTNPPNLVQTMIAMFLSPGNVEADKQLYVGQSFVQLILLAIAFLSVPVMLFAQPLITRSQHAKLYPKKIIKTNHHYTGIDGEDDEYKDSLTDDEDEQTNLVSKPAAHGGHDSHLSADYNFTDHLITQGIHTIEFVLGAVSNTASYLRLWALSLAHAQLAQVFWSRMIMQYGLDTGSPIMLFIGVAVWCGATFGVLLCMDVLECFLHALRLHWVEFQNKFFHADGYAFEPFSFEMKQKEN